MEHKTLFSLWFLITLQGNDVEQWEWYQMKSGSTFHFFFRKILEKFAVFKKNTETFFGLLSFKVKILQFCFLDFPHNFWNCSTINEKIQLTCIQSNVFQLKILAETIIFFLETKKHYFANYLQMFGCSSTHPWSQVQQQTWPFSTNKQQCLHPQMKLSRRLATLTSTRKLWSSITLVSIHFYSETRIKKKQIDVTS